MSLAEISIFTIDVVERLTNEGRFGMVVVSTFIWVCPASRRIHR